MLGCQKVHVKSYSFISILTLRYSLVTEVRNMRMVLIWMKTMSLRRIGAVQPERDEARLKTNYKKSKWP